jgi:hypothetical protein
MTRGRSALEMVAVVENIGSIARGHGGHDTMGVGDARVSLWVLWTLRREDVEGRCS